MCAPFGYKYQCNVHDVVVYCVYIVISKGKNPSGMFGGMASPSKP